MASRMRSRLGSKHRFEGRRASLLKAIVPCMLAYSASCSSDGNQPVGGAGAGPRPGGAGGAAGSAAAGGSNLGGTAGVGAAGVGGNGAAGSGTGGAAASGGAGAVGGGAGMAGGGAATGGSSSGTGGAAGAVGGSAGTGGSAGASSSCPKPQGEICHEFLANDNSRHEIQYVNEFDPTKNWTQQTQDRTNGNSPRQLKVVDNPQATNGKAVLVSVNSGYEEYDLVTHDLLDSVNLGDISVRGAQRLPDGNTVLGIGDAVLRVVTKEGATVGAECNLPGSGSDTLRILSRDPVSELIYYGRGLDIFAVNMACEQQWTATFSDGGSKAYRVLPRQGGGAWATSGEPSTVVEVTSTGQVASQVGGRDVHPNLLDFFSGFDLTASGGIVVANWWGHIIPPPQEGPHLVEFNAANELVWRWGTQAEAVQITNVLVLR